jgi:hypothetical protein
MLSTVVTKLRGHVEIDCTYLSGRKTEKKSYGRVMGARGRHKEKTLLIAQQRESQRCVILHTERHENADAADELVQSIQGGSDTVVYTDGSCRRASGSVFA